MKEISKASVQPSPDELHQWREGYRHYLETKGLTPDQAANMAAKVAYRHDLYPTDSSTTLPLFQLTAPPGSPAPTTHQRAEDSAVVDTRPVKAKPTRTHKAETPATEVIPPKPKMTQTTPRKARLLKTASEIACERPDEDDCGYMHSIMCQVGLPRSKVDATTFERHSGGAAILVEAGKLWDGKQFVQQPVPYGPMPRLVLAWMNTYAVRFNTTEIPVGDSASEFLRMLGKTPNGGRNGVYTTFRKQIQALSACRITLGFNVNGRAHTYEGKPIKHFEAWIASTEEQRPLWPGSVTFSEDYYQTLKSHAVPLDLRAFMGLKGSALAMDIYVSSSAKSIKGKIPTKTSRRSFYMPYALCSLCTLKLSLIHI